MLGFLAAFRDPKVIAVMFIVAFSALVMLSRFPFAEAPKWTGGHVNKLLEVYEQGGYSHTALAEHARNHPARNAASSIRTASGRVLYFWVVGALHEITGLSFKELYPIVAWFGFTLASLLTFIIATEFFGVSLPGATVVSFWMLLGKPVTLILQTQAHPEPLVVALMGLSYYFYRRDWMVPLAVSVFFGGLAKEAIYFLAIFIVIDQLYAVKKMELKRLKAYWPVGLALVGALLVRWFVLLDFPDYGHGVVATPAWLNSFVYPDGLFFIWSGFRFLWIFFLLALWRENALSQRRYLLYMLVCCALLCISHDWFRVLYGVSFFFFFPMVARGIEDSISDRSALIPLVYVVGTVLLFKDFDLRDKTELASGQVFWWLALLGYLAWLDPSKFRLGGRP